jgi:hypothetical protein
MGFEIFLTSVSTDEKDRFDRALVEHAFKNLADDVSGGHWNLVGADGERYSAEVDIREEPRLSGFGVSRPPFVPEFWDAMFEIMRQTRTFLFWPDSDPPQCCIANPDIIHDLPEGMVEALGEPVFASSGAEIEAAVEGRAVG